ncbi:M23 family metallopeptidase [Symbiobacterium terraclitae]|uniref:M23 family metallopeptidase n=1 Tax=Symbiobacterium terraclitae TaxID=557451 RepID=UPI0035B50140
MSIRRPLLVTLLILAISLAAWGSRPVAAVDPGQEAREIGQWIRERQDAAAPPPEGEPAWPVPDHAEITSDYGIRLHPVLKRLRLHAGIDIRAPEGAAAVACLDGKVMAVASLPAYGQVVVIDHGGRLASVYAHLSAVEVQEGDLVARGEPIGRVGATGQVTGAHLHFEIRVNGEPQEPLDLLAALL